MSTLHLSFQMPDTGTASSARLWYSEFCLRLRCFKNAFPLLCPVFVVEAKAGAFLVVVMSAILGLLQTKPSNSCVS